MEGKVLSVVVPMYNVEAYIAQCLDSFAVPEVLDQVEILVIDDGGTDGSAAIAQTYEEKYPGSYRVIHKENGGPTAACVTGMERPQGIIICSLTVTIMWSRLCLPGWRLI